MLPSAENAALRAAVEREIVVLEELCADIERALTARDWDAFAIAMADSRRVTHAMQNAMDDAAPARDQAFDDAIFDRARKVHTIRENQLVRLRTYNRAVAEKIGQITKLKRFAKNIGAKSAPSKLGTLDRLT